MVALMALMALCLRGVQWGEAGGTHRQPSHRPLRQSDSIATAARQASVLARETWGFRQNLCICSIFISSSSIRNA